MNKPFKLNKIKELRKMITERICKVFTETLKEFGAEKQGLESYIRVPATINSKNDSEVQIFAYDDVEVYKLKDIQELWLDELPKWYKNWKGRTKAKNKLNKNVIKLHSVYILNTNRLLNCERIQAYLNSIGVVELRARLCFMYRNYQLIRILYQQGELKDEDYEYAESEMLKFNSKFNYPLKEKDLISATNVVSRRQYLYKNETFRNFFDLDIEDCEKMGLSDIYDSKSQEQWNKEKLKNDMKEYYKENKEVIKEKYKEKLIKLLKEEKK